MTSANDDLAVIIALEVAARPEQVRAAIELLDDESTNPFIHRYRQEVAGGLDDDQLRQIEKSLLSLRELAARRKAILKSIETQSKLTEDVAAEIKGAPTKASFEDLYLPSRKQIAIERQLEQSAKAPLVDSNNAAEAKVSDSVGKNTPNRGAVVEETQEILTEQYTGKPDIIGRVYEQLRAQAGHDGWRVKQRKPMSSIRRQPHYIAPSPELEPFEPSVSNRRRRSASRTDSTGNHKRQIGTTWLSSDVTKLTKTRTPPLRPRFLHLQIVLWLAGVSAMAAAAALAMFPDALGLSLHDRNQITRLDQPVAQMIKRTHEPSGPIINAASASALPEQTRKTKAVEAALLSAPSSSSQEMQRAWEALQTLVEQARNITQ